MVSLGDENNRSGGFFFDTDLRSDTDDLLSDPSLRQSYRRSPVRFHALKTVYSTPFILIIVICQVAAAFSLPHFLKHHDDRHKTTSYSLLLYIHAVVWLLFLISDRFAREEHTISRKQGYLEFYRTTRYLRRMPLMILSGGNALLLILTTILDDYCNKPCDHHNPHHNNTHSINVEYHDINSPAFTVVANGSQTANTLQFTLSDSSECCPFLPLNRGSYLQIVFSIEAAVLIPVLLVYFLKTIKFNRMEAQPDVLDQDHSTTSNLQAQNSPVEIGFRDDTCVDDLMEKQAEMIRYLKEHNIALGKRVMELTSQLHSVST